MTVFQALVIGIVQGLTEFIPISSTAHVRVIPALAGWPDPGAAFSAVIQLGTLLAVLIYFRGDIARMIVAGWAVTIKWIRPRNLDEATSRDGKLAWAIAAGSVPIGLAGLALGGVIETELRSLYVIGAALIALAIVLAVAERVSTRRKDIGDISFADVMAMGFAQTLALIPGVSRSGVTITAGLFRGLNRASAARFSFLLSIPAVLASGLYEMRKVVEHGTGAGALEVVVATVAAFIAGYASIAFLLRFLQTRSTAVFIFYRIVFGTLVLALTAMSVIQ